MLSPIGDGSDKESVDGGLVGSADVAGGGGLKRVLKERDMIYPYLVV